MVNDGRIWTFGAVAVVAAAGFVRTRCGSTDPTTWAYHGTSPEGLRRIRKQGLQPFAPEEQPDVVGVFFCPLPRLALRWGQVLVRFPWPEDSEPDWYSDTITIGSDVVSSNYYTSRPIPVEQIQVNVKGRWVAATDLSGALRRRGSRAARVPLLVLVHPGSACGSAEMHLGREEAREGREGLIDELDAWRGGLLVVDGDFSDELECPFCRELGQAIRDALDRAAQAVFPSERIHADASRSGWVGRVKYCVKRMAPSAVLVSGVWKEKDGCVVAVWEAVRELRIPVEMSEYALTSDAGEE